MAYRIVVIDYSFSFSVKKSGQALCCNIFFSEKKRRNCHSLLDNSMWIISFIVAIDQNAFGVSYSRWRQQRLSRKQYRA